MSDPLNPYSADLKEFFYSAPPEKTAFETLELRHPAFAEPARVVNDLADLTATLEADAPANAGAAVTFSKCNFRFVQPERSDALPSCDLEMENVSKILMPYLQLAVASAAPLDLSFRLFYSEDLSAPGYVMHGLVIKKVTAGILKVTGQATFDNFLGLPFPLRFYNLTEFPGLAL